MKKITLLLSLLLAAGVSAVYYAEAAEEPETVNAEPETVNMEEFKYRVGWDYWQSLPDLLPCLGRTVGDVKEDFPDALEESVSNGILTLATEDGAAQFFCDYDPEKSGDEQEIIQVTLNEEAEYQYRLRDIAVGENRSDSGYWLGADGYLEADTKAAGEDQEEGAYISTYVDPEDPVVFIVLYGRFSDVLGVTVREIREEDIVLYEKEWEKIFG